MLDSDHTFANDEGVAEEQRDTAAQQKHPARLFLLTTAAMVAFAGNSLLCRAALREKQIDAASFTALRIVFGAAVLWLVLKVRAQRSTGGNWFSAVALFGYAAAFSFAYISLAAGTGALLLFAAVQTTMITAGLARGERLHALQWFGVAIAFGGLVFLLLPRLTAPPLPGAMLMLIAGVAWGIYSLVGRGAGEPTAATAGNFIRAVPLALILGVTYLPWLRLSPAGIGYAIVSGAITSGLGYVIWYSALPALRATTAATVQLSAPVISAMGGVLLLGETLTARLIGASIVVLGGIALVAIKPRADRIGLRPRASQPRAR